MATKLIVGLVLILQIQKGISQGTGDCPDFKCSSENSTIVEVYGNRLRCPDGKVCNKWDIQKCEPCVWNMQCELYKCDSEARVNISGRTFDCLEDEVCNKGYEFPCDPCIPRKCSTPLHTCNWHNQTMVTISSIGITITCPIGQKCNFRNVLPCTPCVEDD